MFFRLFRFECFCCRLSTRDGLGHRWPGAAPGRVARHGSTSEAGRTEPGRGQQNKTGNRFGSDLFFEVLLRMSVLIINLYSYCRNI